ncbi:P-loop containing nucleoside triphosphate hydrolase protein [Spinellus fusiger]|nr:P-loop containing nucleoside triphosphate hydrolase protein [Spinellus fusiger]
MATSSSVRVAVRVRPLAEQENQTNTKTIEFSVNQSQLIIDQQNAFTFDYVYPPSADQDQVYSTCVLPLLNTFMKGYNATILAYGQTGSGKTYSMGTSATTHTDSIHNGIVPRFINSLFESVESMRSADHSCQIFVSFLELHNEDIVDLLSSTKREGLNCTIREDSNGQICWTGVREESVNSPEELQNFLQKGSMARKIAFTDMNSASSRSHAIFSVILKQTIYSGGDRAKNSTLPGPKDTIVAKKLVSKFHFVDLAGSERLKRTNAIGDRAKEGISINAGLSALGNVISALGDASRRASHVPYRDSKLTRLLQDSLGGNSQTLMLACVSPLEVNLLETQNTLKYANRARNIRNKVIVNQQLDQDIGLKQQVIQLKDELKSTNEFLAAVNDEMDSLKLQVTTLQQALQATEYERDRWRIKASRQRTSYRQSQDKIQPSSIKMEKSSSGEKSETTEPVSPKPRSLRRPRTFSVQSFSGLSTSSQSSTEETKTAIKRNFSIGSSANTKLAHSRPLSLTVKSRVSGVEEAQQWVRFAQKLNRAIHQAKGKARQETDFIRAFKSSVAFYSSGILYESKTQPCNDIIDINNLRSRCFPIQEALSPFLCKDSLDRKQSEVSKLVKRFEASIEATQELVSIVESIQDTMQGYSPSSTEQALLPRKQSIPQMKEQVSAKSSTPTQQLTPLETAPSKDLVESESDTTKAPLLQNTNRYFRPLSVQYRTPFTSDLPPQLTSHDIKSMDIEPSSMESHTLAKKSIYPPVMSIKQPNLYSNLPSKSRLSLPDALTQLNLRSDTHHTNLSLYPHDNKRRGRIPQSRSLMCR